MDVVYATVSPRSCEELAVAAAKIKLRARKAVHFMTRESVER
jgi:hypothetical protein